MDTTEISAFQKMRHQAGLTIEEVAETTDRHTRTIRRYEKGQDPDIPDEVRLKLEEIAARRHRKATEEREDSWFSFIDLFAGIGGIRQPFEELGGQCLFTSEWDRHARETYAANYSDGPAHQLVGDIREFADNPKSIPVHDVLLAGFPCQPFSIAGVSKKNSLGRPHGFLCDTQGTLFHDLAKIIRYHKPRAFLLENVKNLQRHDGGNTFKTIMNVLKNELKYDVDFRVISSEHWVPQKRERIFIVGFRRHGLGMKLKNLRLPDGKGPTLSSVLDDEVEEKYTLTPKLWQYLQNYKAKHTKAGNGFGYSMFGPDDVTRTLSARYYKDGSEILVEQKGNRPRRLTPRECARLMGFERKGTNRPFVIPVSDTQAYRQFGNSVVVPKVRAVAEFMLPFLEKDLKLLGRI